MVEQKESWMSDWNRSPKELALESLCPEMAAALQAVLRMKMQTRE
jgi:hypothetical protein